MIALLGGGGGVEEDINIYGLVSECIFSLSLSPLLYSLRWEKKYGACYALCNCTGRKGFPGTTSGKEPAYQCRRLKRCGFYPWVGKVPWRRKWQPTLVFLPGESQDRGAWWATVRSVAKSQTRLSTHAPQKQKYVIFLKASFLTSPRRLACIYLLLNPCRHFTIHFLISFSLHFSLSP